jgi:hypothetical protein
LQRQHLHIASSRKTGLAHHFTANYDDCLENLHQRDVLINTSQKHIDAMATQRLIDSGRSGRQVILVSPPTQNLLFMWFGV